LDRADKLLAGKTIVVTRAPEQAQELVRLLEQFGAEVLLLPMVNFVPPQNWLDLDASLRALGEFDWILFTSQNAVRFVCRRCAELGLVIGSLQSPRPLVAAVGPATARAARNEGLRVDFVAEGRTGEALGRELLNSLEGCSVLLPRSDQGDDRLSKVLHEGGARVTEVVAYRTALPEKLDAGILQRIRRGEVNAIVFASPSAFHNLSAFIEPSELARLSTAIQFAAIGPSTAQALRESGVQVEVEANESSAAGIADAIAGHYERQSSTMRRA
jgi:uroporphyrinogen III methyltransferase/synthase